MTERISPPLPAGLLREATGLFEFPRLLVNVPRLMRTPQGANTPVMVLPGFGTTDASTGPLRTFLRLRGYRTYRWKQGLNRGNVERMLPRVRERVERLADRAGSPVALVGWSLGGVFARETARDRPDLVSRIVTLGTPVIGGPKYTAAAGFYRNQGVDLDALESAIDDRFETPIRTRMTAIYSKNDGVVSWRACIDGRSPDIEHVEVAATHVGLGVSTEVYEIVADRLNAPLAAPG